MAKQHRDRGDGALYQRANGIWVGSVEVPSTDGKRRRATVSSKRKEEANRKLRKLQREVEDGTFAASGKTTVAQWCDRWLISIVKPRVKPKTFQHYEEAVRILIKPNLGTVRLSKLTQQHVRNMHAAVQVTSTRNAVKAHQALQKALTDAVREGLIARNVAELVDRPKHLTQTRGALTSRAALALINTAVDRGDPLAARWAAGFYTGARPGELLGLQWDRVDLAAGVIDLAWQLQGLRKVHGCVIPQRNGVLQRNGEVYACGKSRASYCPKARFDLPPAFDHKPLQGSLVLTRPKTRAGTRIVPLARPLLAMLRAHRAATIDRPNPHDLVWHDGNGNPIHARDDHHAWVQACVACGLAKRGDDGKGWAVKPPAPYVSRHTAGTLLQEAEVPEDIRMALMGHSSIVAHRGYLHTELAPLRHAIAALEAVYEDDSQSA